MKEAIGEPRQSNTQAHTYSNPHMSYPGFPSYMKEVCDHKRVFNDL